MIELSNIYTGKLGRGDWVRICMELVQVCFPGIGVNLIQIVIIYSREVCKSHKDTELKSYES
jgi:hypothetical protein